MITDLNKIADEWSYRVGSIDYKDETHLYHLDEILRENGWTQEVIDSVTYSLKNGNTAPKKDKVVRQDIPQVINEPQKEESKTSPPIMDAKNSYKKIY